MRTTGCSLLVALALAAPVAAQTVAGDRFTLTQGPCTIRSGNGPPPAALGKVCDTYVDTVSGNFWVHRDLAWQLPTAGVGGSGTPNRLARWTTASTLGDAAINEDSGNLGIDPTANIYLGPGGRLILPASPHKYNLGQLTNKYLTLHAAELWVETLVAQQTMATIGGRILVGPTNVLISGLLASAPPDAGGDQYGSTWKYNNMVVGDLIYMESASGPASGAIGKFEAFRVSGGPFTGIDDKGDTYYGYYVQRNQDGTGPNDWYPGDAAFNTGQVGAGFIDLYSVRGIASASQAGPTIVGNVRTGAGAMDFEPRWAIGNLNGLYGYGNTYGAAFGKPGGARLTIDPNNGIVMADGLNNLRVHITPTGTAAFHGDGNGVTNINGGNIQTGTISANKLTVGNARNLFRNSECRVSIEGFSYGGNAGLSVVMGQAFAGWQLNNETGTCYISTMGVPAAGYVMYAYTTGQRFYVKGNVPGTGAGGLRYELSAYVGLHRINTAEVVLRVFNAGGAFMGYVFGAQAKQCTKYEGAGGTTLDGYCRVWAITPPLPEGSVTAEWYIQGYTDGDPIGQPYIFWTRAFFGEAKATQTEPSEWSPAGVTEIIGDQIRTGTIVARTIAADQITSDHIAAGTIVASDIAARSLTADRIGVGQITATEIGARQITADRIGVGQITATEIAAGTITTDKLNVGQLSAISADMGNLTAGSITGGTIDGAIIRAGSGDEVTLDSSGMSFAAGTGTNNRIKWSDGSFIFSHPSYGGIVMAGGGSGIYMGSGTYFSSSVTMGNFSLIGTNRFVCHDNNGTFYSSNIDCDGSGLALAQEVATLRAEVAALRTQLRERKH